jgi:hypothetical protein
MARKTNARTVLNRRCLDAIDTGFVDGMAAMGQAWVATVHPPDATPFGQGLVTTPDYGIWAHGKKVAGGAAKPRTLRVKKMGIVLVCGEGFPGRFQELGTVNMPPQPHVTPAMLQVLHGAAGYIRPKMRAALARVR